MEPAMKRSEAIKKVREIENAIEVQRLEKLRQMEAEMDLENRESNRNRARSITVGTAFGGTTEIMMRSDGGRHIWCIMQPTEVVEESAKQAGNDNPDVYWIAKLMNKQGTLYDADNKGRGFDWGCFGALPWKWVTCSGSYEGNKIEFTEPFECSATEDSITIGHLHFTFNPK